MRVKDTESGTVVWDDVNEEEEHPFHHPDPRFDEPIYEHEYGQEFLPNEEPQFDEDGFSPDEEECLLVRMALIGNTVQEAKQNEDGEDCMYSERNVSVDDDEVAFKSLLAKDGGVSMLGIGIPMAMIGGPSLSQKDSMGLFIDPRLSVFQINGDWHNQPINGEFEKEINIQKKVNILVCDKVICMHDHGTHVTAMCFENGIEAHGKYTFQQSSYSIARGSE
ncbi:uncharacterized protein LOC143597415 [Bidens hawaiensis]|uniref:uncharacterized protein LOC143597415 n=1 Tax=Bidens hawaiensis TaxID=980011 RepID=UPI0040494EBD